MPEDASPVAAVEASPSPEAVVETPVVSEALPALSKREEVYAKYQSLYGEPTEAPPVVVPEVVAEPALPAVVDTETPPVPDVPAVEAVPAALSATETLLARMTALMESQAAALAAAEAREIARNAPPPVPVIEVEPAFITKLREGDVKGAVEAMKASILAEIAKAPKAADPQVLVQQAIEKMQLENELGSFLTTLRRDNPDIVPMESYIAGAVEQRMNEAKAKGHLTSGPAYAKAYKTAVADEIVKARKIIQLSRAAGAIDARTSQREVLSSATVVPQAVADRGLTQGGPPVPDMSPTSYLNKRFAVSQAGKGLS